MPSATRRDKRPIMMIDADDGATRSRRLPFGQFGYWRQSFDSAGEANRSLVRNVLSVAILARGVCGLARRVSAGSWGMIAMQQAAVRAIKKRPARREHDEKTSADNNWTGGVGHGTRHGCRYGREGAASGTDRSNLQLDGVLYRWQWWLGAEPQLRVFP